MSSSRAHCEPAGPDRTVAEVFDRFSEHFFSRYRHHLPKGAFKTLQDILLCRTEAMGGHRFRCDRCGHVHFAWHSCNNRLCPTCGAADNAAWTAAHLNRLLPVPYFLVTFTLPSELRQYAYSHPGAFYKLFFTATSRALKEILADPKRTGFFKSGFFAVLQSWKQDMLLHPHIHYVVPGIGLDGKGNLVTLKQPDFLVYAQVLANRLRTLMLQALQSEPRIDSALIAQLWRIDWVADVEPVGSGENAVKYLGQYVHKSVITDRRISPSTPIRSSSPSKTVKTNAPAISASQASSSSAATSCMSCPPAFTAYATTGFLHPRAKATLQLLQTLLDADLSMSHSNDSTPHPDSLMLCPRCGYPMTRLELRSRSPPQLRRHAFLEQLAA